MISLKFDKKTLIMGILNITPDSFYDGGNYFDKDKAVERAFQMHEAGADIIDIGGESTRPGSKSITIQEELDRVCPVIESLSRNIDIPLSIDTYKSAVAEEALKLGATVVNDISGLSFDKKMTDVVVKYKSHIILMHIKGTPENMQHNPKYSDLIGEIYGFLDNARNTAIRNGINKEKIIIDPGIGFGKTVEHNYQIISNLEYFKKMEAPILIGLSRKSLIGKLYDNGSNRLPATIALNSLCVINGADIIRVHDVKEHKLALTALEMIKKVNNINGNCN